MKNKICKLFSLVDNWLYKCEAALLVTCTLLVLIFGFLPIFLRMTFDTSIIWAPELNRLMVLWITFFGASLAIRENKHISLEVLTQFLPKNFARPVKALIYIFVIFVCATYTYIAYVYFGFEKSNINLGDYLFGSVAKTWFKIIYPFGFACFTYHYFVKLLLLCLMNPAEHNTTTQAN